MPKAKSNPTPGRAKNELNHSTYIYWKNQIEAAIEWREQKFNPRGEKIINRYRGDGDDMGENRYNILYSNTETLEPVVYNSPPQAEVRAEHSKKIASRHGAAMIEEAINYYVNNEDFGDVARTAVKDFLLPGLGVLRPVYTPLISEEGEEDRLFEDILFEEIRFKYVHWRDLIFPECSCWEDLPWVAFRSYVTYEEAVDLFGKKKADSLNYMTMEVVGQKYYKGKKRMKAAKMVAVVYEIWDKLFREQVFYSDGLNTAPIEINDDPLELDNFWPIPRPLFSITTSGTILPVPFFSMYQDQAIELDTINSRIYHILDNMRVNGFYDAQIKELGNIENMGDNTYWPVKNWAEFASKGGVNGVMQNRDITPFINALTVLIEARDRILNDIFQIIGISDIRRAQTDPRETLGAQKLKSRYGTIRISTYQRKVAEFMRELLAITGEIIIRQFEPQTLAIITNRKIETTKEPMQEKDPETGEMVDKLDELGNPVMKITPGVADLLNDLREKEPIDIKIDIQTDSTIIENEEENRATLREGVEALAQFTEVAPALIQGFGLEAVSKIALEIVQRFKLGRTIQQDVEDYLDKLAEEGLPKQEDPATIVAQAEIEKERIRAEADGFRLMLQAQVDAAKIRLAEQENMLKAAELGVEAKFKEEKINLEAIDKAIKARGLQIEARSTDNEVVGV